MREMDEIIKDQMEYILCKLYAEFLYSSSVINKRELNRVIKQIKKNYDPPTEMMEGYNGKKNTKNRE